MDNLSALPLAADQFAAIAALVTPDDLTLPTPCGEWNVAQLIEHVVGGNLMAASLLAGSSRDEAVAILSGVDLGDDPHVPLRDSLRAQAQAFADPAALDLVVHHPAMDMPGSQLLGFRVGDLLVHSWDLARAIGADETLDPEVVAVVAQNIEPMRPFIGQVGMFGDGPSGDLPVDTDAQMALLDLMGRRP